MKKNFNWQSLSFQTRNRVLWIGAGVFLLIAYQMAFQPTLEAYQTYRRLSAQLQSSGSSAAQMQHTKREMAQFEQYLASYRTDSSRTDPLLSGLTPLCRKHDVRIQALLPAQEEQQEDYQIITRPVRLQGKYISLLKVIHGIEYQLKVGRLSSVQFRLEEDPISRKKNLYAECYIQHLKEVK